MSPKDIGADDGAGVEFTERNRADIKGKNCFVVIPYDKDAGPDGVPYDFERVYDDFIYPTVTSLGLSCDRSKDRHQPGLIHKSMIEEIIAADLVIVDISTGNANVLYELGIRHTARPIGTVIVKREGAPRPFNIAGMRSISYHMDDAAKLDHAKASLRGAIVAALAFRSVDSLVHQIVPGLNVSMRARALQHRECTTWAFPEETVKAVTVLASKRIGMITGDLVYVDDVDVWVNPENTRMEMARVHDDSVSATIRYHGGKRNVRGNLERDLIADELQGKVDGHIVEATTVIDTGPGELKRPNRVRRIFHLAAQHGEPGKGYVTVRSIEDCIKSALEKMDTINRERRFRIGLGLAQPLRSIIFPLFGTRGPSRDPQATADALVQAAVSYLSTWPASRIEKVYFLAYTDRDRELCETAFLRLNLKKDGAA
jgi:O-acetyl-ADP-ribose deacetylase (regulator of RNase III)